MAYSIPVDLGAAEGIRYVIEDQLTKIERSLGSEENVHEQVAEIRKRYKRIRAAARMARGGLEDDYNPFNVLFRDAGRSLSLIRDAQAQIETLDAVSRSFEEFGNEEAILELRRELVARRDRMTEALEIQAIVDSTHLTLEQGRAMMADWSWTRDKFKDFKPGLKKSYRRAKKHMKKAYKKNDTYHFHEWRKYAKYHRAHLRLFRKTVPKLIKPRVRYLAKITNTLGDDHDIEIFIDMVSRAEVEIDPRTWERLERVLEARSAQLRERVEPLGKLLFEEKNKVMYRRLKRYWKFGRR